MPEERGLYPRMALGEQLADFGTVHRLSTAAAQAADEWLERLGLSDRAGARLKALSHGNQQRAQLAAAVIHAPDLLVLDEPFAGLDPLAVRTLAGVLRREAERGAAVRSRAISSSWWRTCARTSRSSTTAASAGSATRAASAAA